MNEFYTHLWTGGRANDFYFFGFEGSPETCTVESFVQTVVPEEKCAILDNAEFNRNSKNRSIYRGNELQEQIANYIESLEQPADLYIIDTPSVLYVFSKSKTLRDGINEKIRSL